MSLALVHGVCRRRVPTVRPSSGARRHSSSSSSSPSRSSSSSSSPIAVFWDFENCPVPSSLDPFLLRPNIERSLRRSGLLGPISFRGYGNIQLISRAHVLEALSETGVDLHHVPNDGKNSSDRALLIDMLFWTFKHSPPAHVLLISGDSDFSVLIHKMRMLSYDVLLAAPNKTGISPALVSAANKVWVWPDIVMSEKTTIQEYTGDVSSGGPRSKGTKPSPADLLETDRGSTRTGNEDSSKYELDKMIEAQWLPPHVTKKIIEIIEERPGIPLGHISKELRSFNINPRSFGFTNFYQLLMSIQQLQVCYVDGLNMKDRVKFYLAIKAGSPAHMARGTLNGGVISEKVSQSESNDLHDGETANQMAAASGKREALGEKQNSASKKKKIWYSWFTNLFNKDT